MSKSGRALLFSTIAALFCIASLLGYNFIHSRAEKKTHRITAVYRTPSFESMTMKFPAPFPFEEKLGEPQWKSVPVNMVPQTGVNTASMERGSIYYWTKVHPFRYAPQRQGYVAPDIYYAPNLNTGRHWNHGFRYLCMAASTLLVFIGSFLLISNRGRLRRVFFGLSALRLASLFWMFGIFGFFSFYINDEKRYLEHAERIIDWGSSHAQYMYTIGLPLLYAPFLAIWRTTDSFLFSLLFGAGSFFIFGIGVIGLFVLLIPASKRGASLGTGAGLAMILYPWIASLASSCCGKNIS